MVQTTINRDGLVPVREPHSFFFLKAVLGLAGPRVMRGLFFVGFCVVGGYLGGCTGSAQNYWPGR